jgi:hypothetical protein
LIYTNLHTSTTITATTITAVLGSGNRFDGSTVNQLKHGFAEHYNASVIAVRRKGVAAGSETKTAESRRKSKTSDEQEHDNDVNDAHYLALDKNLEISEQRVNAGDLVLVLAKDEVLLLYM